MIDFDKLPAQDKIYYQDDSVVIYCADCREILPLFPDKSFDLVLTDPPYGNGTNYDYYEDTQDNLLKISLEILPMIIGKSLVAAMTTGVGNMFKYNNPDWCLCWYIGQAGQGSTKWGFNCWQPVIVWGKDPYLASGLGRRADSIFDSETSDKTINHPCPKPTNFWRKVVLRLSPFVNQTILDPFLGSGTTAVAAKILGRKAVGIEISEKYCKIATDRCRQSVMQLDIPREEVKQGEFVIQTE